MRVPNLCLWRGCNKPWRGRGAQSSPVSAAASRLPPPPTPRRPPPAPRPPPSAPRCPQRKPRGNEISASRQLTAEHPGRSQAGGGRPLSRPRSPPGLQMDWGNPAASRRRKRSASRMRQPPNGGWEAGRLGGVAGVMVGIGASPNLSPLLARPL